MILKNRMSRIGDNANIIIPRLWLGNKNAAADATFLQDNNIRAVFNCTKTLPFEESVLHKYRVPVDDNLEPQEIKNMQDWAPEAVLRVVQEYKHGNSILIHCHAGMQRSAALMAMTLIALTRQPADSVMSYIRSKRPIAFFPAANFDRSIRGFEKQLQYDFAASQ
jgi:protein-tyrosine phosphatase